MSIMDWLCIQLMTMCLECSSKSLISMMIDAFCSLLDNHKKERSLNDIWTIMFQRRREQKSGLEKWKVMKFATKGVDVKTILFGIPPGRASRQPLRLQDFMLYVVAPHIYDRFIGA